MATTSAAVLAYRPCFVSESATGAQVSTQLIVVNPRGLSSTAAGVAVTPKLIEIQPTLIKVPDPARTVGLRQHRVLAPALSASWCPRRGRHAQAHHQGFQPSSSWCLPSSCRVPGAVSWRMEVLHVGHCVFTTFRGVPTALGYWAGCI